MRMLRSRGFRSWRRRLLEVVVVSAIAVGAPGVSLAAPSRVSAFPAVAHAQLTLRTSEYGKVIFDSRDRVLYLFGADRGVKSTCYGACAAAWPPLLTKGAPTAGPGLDAKLLGTTKRKDGSVQVTYDGHPLYYYAADQQGKVMCQHAVMHGGLWLVVRANGTPSLAKGKM